MAVPDAREPLLACVARHFAAVVDHDHLRVPDGRTVPLSDGREKSFDEVLDTPDVEDMFALAYAAGPITPVLTPNHDPGRVRVEALFEATYGATEKAVRAELVPCTIAGHTVVVHRRAKAAFERVAARLDALLAKEPSLRKFFDKMGGTFLWREIAGTHRKSAHSFGIALDLNPAFSHYWRNDQPPKWQNQVPAAIVDAFEAEGFAWGGRWYHYDTMHFEYRPELFACAK